MGEKVVVVDFAADEQRRKKKRGERRGQSRDGYNDGKRGRRSGKRARNESTFGEAWESVMKLGSSRQDKSYAKRQRKEALERAGIRTGNQKVPFKILQSMKKTHARRAAAREKEENDSGVVLAKKSKKKNQRKKNYGDPGLRELTAGKFKGGVLYISSKNA